MVVPRLSHPPQIVRNVVEKQAGRAGTPHFENLPRAPPHTQKQTPHNTFTASRALRAPPHTPKQTPHNTFTASRELRENTGDKETFHHKTTDLACLWAGNELFGERLNPLKHGRLPKSTQLISQPNQDTVSQVYIYIYTLNKIQRANIGDGIFQCQLNHHYCVISSNTNQYHPVLKKCN